MDIKIYNLTGSTADLISTEILYSVASAKACGGDLIKYVIEEISTSKINAVIRMLKSLKKQGKIQLYAYSDNFSDELTEVVYLLNKYPNIKEYIKDGTCFIVKI